MIELKSDARDLTVENRRMAKPLQLAQSLEKMDRRPAVIERAFQLAGSGEFRSLSEVKIRLSAEGYMDLGRHFSGRLLSRELRERLAAARRTISAGSLQ